ncbi:agamous-like MADS-box protein AGL53 [Musa acuminata AAA Group]|uniref:agamous-like MADS-box protein AGL53 n=1 Tax=Musa acuminata AAA Group TaxID=214697 RepID=UPI0031D6C3C6
MGRRNLCFELIPDTKARRRSFARRCKGLRKKASEIHKLCDLDVLVISFSSDDDKMVAWPEEPEEVRRIVHRFLIIDKRQRERWSNSLVQVLEERVMQKTRAKKMPEDYATRVQRLDGLSKDKVADLLHDIDCQMSLLKLKIKLLAEKMVASQQQLDGGSQTQIPNDSVDEEYMQPKQPCDPAEEDHFHVSEYLGVDLGGDAVASDHYVAGPPAASYNTVEMGIANSLLPVQDFSDGLDWFPWPPADQGGLELIVQQALQGIKDAKN